MNTSGREHSRIFSLETKSRQTYFCSVFLHGHDPQDDLRLHRGQPRRLGLRTRVAVVDCTGQGAKFLRGLQLLLQRRVHLLVPL